MSLAQKMPTHMLERVGIDLKALISSVDTSGMQLGESEGLTKEELSKWAQKTLRQIEIARPKNASHVPKYLYRMMVVLYRVCAIRAED